MQAGYPKQNHADHLLYCPASFLRRDGRDIHFNHAWIRTYAHSVHDRIRSDNGCPDRAASLACGNLRQRYQKDLPGQRSAAVAWSGSDKPFRLFPSFRHEFDHLPHRTGNISGKDTCKSGTILLLSCCFHRSFSEHCRYHRTGSKRSGQNLHVLHPDLSAFHPVVRNHVPGEPSPGTVPNCRQDIPGILGIQTYDR